MNFLVLANQLFKKVFSLTLAEFFRCFPPCSIIFSLRFRHCSFHLIQFSSPQNSVVIGNLYKFLTISQKDPQRVEHKNANNIRLCKNKDKKQKRGLSGKRRKSLSIVVQRTEQKNNTVHSKRQIIKDTIIPFVFRLCTALGSFSVQIGSCSACTIISRLSSCVRIIIPKIEKCNTLFLWWCL